MTMSYMDYGNDPCLYMFSQGQTDVMDTYVGILQSQFKPNTIPVCVQIPEYIITNGSVTSCNGLFYDSGGPGDAMDPGQYSNNEVYTYPKSVDQQIAALKIRSFGKNFDKLKSKQEKYLNSWELGTGSSQEGLE